METLTNAHTRRGEEKPLHVGITTDIFPEVQRLMSENSYIGITSDYVHQDNHYWKQSIKKGFLETYLLPGFIFVYMARNMTYKDVKRPAPSAKYLKYYTDKMEPIEPITEYNPPFIISEQKMRQTMNIIEAKNKHVMIISKESCHFKSSNRFQVVYGEFQDIEGKVVKATS